MFSKTINVGVNVKRQRWEGCLKMSTHNTFHHVVSEKVVTSVCAHTSMVGLGVCVYLIAGERNCSYSSFLLAKSNLLISL